MRGFYFLLLVTIFGAQARAQVCTIGPAQAFQDFCTVCSTGANPALVDGVFTGSLIVTTTYTISASCLNNITFTGYLDIDFDLPNGATTMTLTFEQDPWIEPGTVTQLGANKSGRGNIMIYGNTWIGKGNSTYSWPSLEAYMNSDAAYRVMPVSLVDWQVKEVRNTVDLSWTTSEEADHDYFVLEHAADGQHFQPLVAIMKAERSYEGLWRDYHYVHNNPAPGTNYYRLVQYDTDGKATTFETRSVQVGTSIHNGVHPNPAYAGQRIGLNESEGLHEAALFSLDGTLVATFHEPDADLAAVTLPSDLSSGTYVLRAGRQTHRVFVR